MAKAGLLRLPRSRIRKRTAVGIEREPAATREPYKCLPRDSGISQAALSLGFRPI